MSRTFLALFLATLTPALAQDRLSVGDVLKVEVDRRSGATADVSSADWTPGPRYFDRIQEVTAEGRPKRVLRQIVKGQRLDLMLLRSAARARLGWMVLTAEGRELSAEGFTPFETFAWLQATSGEAELPVSPGLFDACGPRSRVQPYEAWPDLQPCLLELLQPLDQPITGGRWVVEVARPAAPALVEVTASVTLRFGQLRPGVWEDGSTPDTAAAKTTAIRVRVSRATSLPSR